MAVESHTAIITIMALPSKRSLAAQNIWNKSLASAVQRDHGSINESRLLIMAEFSSLILVKFFHDSTTALWKIKHPSNFKPFLIISIKHTQIYSLLPLE